MADFDNLAESQREALKTMISLLTCPWCNTLLSKPRRMPCGHAFCSSCSKRAVDEKNGCSVCTVPAHVNQCLESVQLANITASVKALADALDGRHAQRSSGLDLGRAVVDSAVGEPATAGGSVASLGEAGGNEGAAGSRNPVVNARTPPPPPSAPAAAAAPAAPPAPAEPVGLPSASSGQLPLRGGAASSLEPPSGSVASLADAELPAETPQLARLGRRRPSAGGASGGTDATAAGQSGARGEPAVAAAARLPTSAPTPLPSLPGAAAAESAATSSSGGGGGEVGLVRRTSSRGSASAVVAAASGASPPGSAPAAFVVMGTSLLDPDKAALAELVRVAAAAGVRILSIDAFDPARPPTHVVTQTTVGQGRDAAGNARALRTCKRTLKTIQGVLSGAWLLDAQWLHASARAGTPVPEAPFEVETDLKSLPQPAHWFGPAKARAMAAERRGVAATPTGLFENISAVLIGPYEKISTDEVACLLRLGGAELVAAPPAPQRLPEVENGRQRVVFVSSSAAHLRSIPANVVTQIKSEICLDPIWLMDSVSALQALPAARFIVPVR